MANEGLTEEQVALIFNLHTTTLYLESCLKFEKQNF